MGPCLYFLYDTKVCPVRPSSPSFLPLQSIQPCTITQLINSFHPSTHPPTQITPMRPIKDELSDVWSMVQRKSVLLPMAFVAIYQSFWLPMDAWDVFLIKGLGFNEWRMGVLGLVGTIAGAGGAWFYRSYLLHTNWRAVFGWSLVLMAAMDMINLLLVFRINVKVNVLSHPPTPPRLSINERNA